MASSLLISSLLAAPSTSLAGYVPKGPKFSWDTLPVFYHSSNKTGPYSDDSINFLATHFPMVTVEKFQGPCGYAVNASPACHQESLIIAELKRVKMVNSNVSTIFYYNSVLDFPQYDLHGMMLANTSLLLHNENGDIVNMTGGGHRCDVFDFSNPTTRELFIQECYNATQTGYVDGCFLDRAVDGTPVDGHNDTVPCSTNCASKVSPEKAAAYFEGHIKVLTDLQTAIGDGPVIANHAYGPPHDSFIAGSVNFDMIEGFGANGGSIEQLMLSVANGRGCQAHSTALDIDHVAAFLIGAGHRSYFGVGNWNTADPTAHWDPMFDKPLGPPQGPATKSADGSYTRKFGTNITVTFYNGKGTITGW